MILARRADRRAMRAARRALPDLIELLHLPTGPGLRIDTGVDEGDEIAAEFDSMIAKIIAGGRTRAEARCRGTKSWATPESSRCCAGWGRIGRSIAAFGRCVTS